MLHLILTEQALECSPKVLLRTAPSQCFFGNRTVEQQFAMRLQKGDCLFLIIYQNQHAANTSSSFLPFLRSLKDLQKLLCSMSCTSLMRSKDQKRAVNQTTKGLLTKCFILTPLPR